MPNQCQYGQIKEIRLVARKSIAFAYIEFESAESAQKSLEMNQKSIEPDRKLGVAISNPKKHTYVLSHKLIS